MCGSGLNLQYTNFTSIYNVVIETCPDTGLFSMNINFASYTNISQVRVVYSYTCFSSQFLWDIVLSTNTCDFN